MIKTGRLAGNGVMYRSDNTGNKLAKSLQATQWHTHTAAVPVSLNEGNVV